MLNSDYAIKSYVNICNKALQGNKERFPFKQILGAVKNAEKGKKVEIQVAGEDKIDSYVFYIEDDQIKVMPHAECDKCQCDRQFHMEWQYLYDVLRHPDSYIKNPAKIDWNWIYGNVN